MVGVMLDVGVTGGSTAAPEGTETASPLNIVVPFKEEVWFVKTGYSDTK